MRVGGCSGFASKFLFFPRSKEVIMKDNFKMILTRVIREKEKLRRVCGITVRVLEPKDIGEWRYTSFLGHVTARDREKYKEKDKDKNGRTLYFQVLS